MAKNVRPQEIDQFSKVVNIPDSAITERILESVRRLHEIRQLEPAIQQILHDTNETPHGPTEIADVITPKVVVRGERVLAAFILKGRSFPKVTSETIAHQLFKIRQLEGLQLLVLWVVGNIQDDAHRDFIQTALDANVDYLIVDAQDCARILLAYEKICSIDGSPFDDTGSCEEGHQLDQGIKLEFRTREDLRFEVSNLRDISHGLAKRYSAVILTDPHYERDTVREIILRVNEQVRNQEYYRNNLTRDRWRGEKAHVVWLYLAADLEDVRQSNWFVQTQWVDENLPEDFRPLPLKADEHIHGISISWNEIYSPVKEHLKKHSVSKGESLDRLEPLLNEAIELGKYALDINEQFERGKIDQEQLTKSMRDQDKRVSEVYMASGNLSFPPEDLKEYDEVAQRIFADVDNLFLYFRDSGLERWPEEQRRYLFRDSIQHFREDLNSLEYEQKKIH